jgi:hypothetical protein
MTIRKATSYSRRPWPSPPRHHDAELRPPASRPPSGPPRARTQGSRPMTPNPGQPAPADQETTGDAAARDQVRQLHDQGATYRAIARTAGTGAMTIHDLATDRHPPLPATVTAVLRVSAASVPTARVDAGGTRLRLRALHVMGHGSTRLAHATGVSDWTIRQILRGRAPTVSVQLRDQVVVIYDQWWEKRAPERTPGERLAATRARRRAITGNWCAAAALDDDELDTPGYKPRYGWRPATGTGVAPDIAPPRSLRLRACP